MSYNVHKMVFRFIITGRAIMDLLTLIFDFSNRISLLVPHPFPAHGTKWQVLANLAVIGDGCVQSEIAESAGLCGSSVSVTIRDLEEEGYIRRESVLADRRARRVFLTEKGHDVYDQYVAQLQRMESNIYAEMSAEERDDLIQKLTLLMERLG